VPELARFIGCDNTSCPDVEKRLRRLLRGLTTYGVFLEGARDTWENTASSGAEIHNIIVIYLGHSTLAAEYLREGHPRRCAARR